MRGVTQWQQKVFYFCEKTRLLCRSLISAHLSGLKCHLRQRRHGARRPAGPGFVTLSLNRFIPRSWNNRTQDPNLAAEADSTDFCFLPLYWCALQFCAGQLLAISGELPGLRRRAITDHYGEHVNLSAATINSLTATVTKLTRQIRPMRDWVMGLWPTSEAFSRKKK